MILNLEFSGLFTCTSSNLASASLKSLFQSSKSRSFPLWIAHSDKSKVLINKISWISETLGSQKVRTESLSLDTLKQLPVPAIHARLLESLLRL